MSRKSSLEKGGKVAGFSSFALAMIGLAKGFVGVFSGSIGLLAQAVDSLTDVFASLTVYVGLKFAQKEPTEMFPYGYYRAETLASLMVAGFIVISGIEILRESAMRFLHPMVVSFPQITMFVVAISIALLYLLASYNKKVGEQISSQAVVGQAKHFTTDVVSSILVLVGVLSSHMGILWIEPIIGVLITVFILKTGVELGRDATLTLMDAVLTPEHIDRIRRISGEVPGVIAVYDLKLRKSGPVCFGELRVDVEEGLPIEKAHAITEEIERRAKQEYKELETLVIHMEPAKREKFRVAVPVKENSGLESTARPHFGGASHFILVDVDRGQITNWFVKPNPGSRLRRKKGMATANFLITEKVDKLLATKLGEGPFHMLRDGFVEIYELPENSGIRESIESLIQGKMEKLASPKNPNQW